MAFSISLEQELNRWNNAIRSHPNDPKAYIQRGMVNFKLALIEEERQKAEGRGQKGRIWWGIQTPTK